MAGYHHGNLRAALLAAAAAQVAAHGAEKVSLRALAGSLGVSPSAAYQHFGDKDELLVAVAERGFAELGARMTAARDTVTGDDDQAVLTRFAEIGSAYVNFAIEQAHTFRLMFGPLCGRAADGHTLDEAEKPPGSAYAVLTRIMAELDARGLLRVPDDDGLRLMIWSTVHGFANLVIEGQVDATAGQHLFDVVRRLVVR